MQPLTKKKYFLNFSAQFNNFFHPLHFHFFFYSFCTFFLPFFACCTYQRKESIMIIMSTFPMWQKWKKTKTKIIKMKEKTNYSFTFFVLLVFLTQHCCEAHWTKPFWQAHGACWFWQGITYSDASWQVRWQVWWQYGWHSPSFRIPTHLRTQDKLHDDGHGCGAIHWYSQVRLQIDRHSSGIADLEHCWSQAGSHSA